MHIRPMTEDDWPAVSQIYRQGMDTGVATFEYEVPSYAVWDQKHLPCCRLVAERERQVAGFVALSPTSARPVYRGVAEVSVYVSPAHARQGIGLKLLEALIRCADQNGIWTLQSGIWCDNPASIRLHERAGFRLVGRREKIGKDRQGIWRDTVLMEHRSETVW